MKSILLALTVLSLVSWTTAVTTYNSLGSGTASFVVDSAKTTLSVTFSVAKPNIWVCIGYSPNLAMSGTTAICGCDGTTSGTLHQYSLVGTSQGSQQTISASISSAACSTNTTHTTISFTQPYTTTATSGLLIADASGNVKIAMAYGYSNTFQQHDQRVATTQNVLTSTTSAPTKAALGFQTPVVSMVLTLACFLFARIMV
jgi:hypothetical protein